MINANDIIRPANLGFDSGNILSGIVGDDNAEPGAASWDPNLIFRGHGLERVEPEYGHGQIGCQRIACIVGCRQNDGDRAAGGVFSGSVCNGETQLLLWPLKIKSFADG